jgi:RNA polymerase sigma-70 factor (ECF subfamily)
MPSPGQSVAQGTANPAFPPEVRALCRELYTRSRAAEYGIAAAEFEASLHNIAGRYCPSGHAAEIEDLLRSLQIEDLALAQACAAGSEPAWEVFLTRFRAKLYECAYGITRDEARGGELADALYADLYGTTMREGRRVSKLASYSGRGSLMGWLRMVLAQEFVNRYRAQSRLVSLEQQEEAGTQFAAIEREAAGISDRRVNAAVDAALGELNPDDRFVLASYFLDGRKLNEIGRVLRVHESSVSRRLDKITSRVRKRVIHHLEASGMSRRQAQEALEADVRDLSVDVRARLREQREERPAGP